MVEFAHPDFIAFNWTETNDTYYTNQWNLSKINITNAWNITQGSSSILIAILDSGVESDHPDIDLVTGYDVVDNNYSTDPYDNIYHGTACAGIASAITNNSLGIAGVGYNCKIMPIQSTHSTDWSSSSNFAAGINWASSNGAHVISISGNTNSADAVNNAINNATSNGRNGKGCIIVKSAGNNGEENITYPGQHSKVIAVGATDENDYRRSYSSYGNALDVMAPSSVYATDLSGSSGATAGDYNSDFTGTSAAAPHVSGLAGLILSVDNSLTEQQVRNIIQYTADDKGSTG
ncbi:S8 family serine peptidase [candidate division KSB1 bacterium]|nr:S8 family serine peptidase [candidate division KSB1 bacterium]